MHSTVIRETEIYSGTDETKEITYSIFVIIKNIRPKVKRGILTCKRGILIGGPQAAYYAAQMTLYVPWKIEFDRTQKIAKTEFLHRRVDREKAFFLRELNCLLRVGDRVFFRRLRAVSLSSQIDFARDA